MALKGRDKALYMTKWWRADGLARHRAILKFPPLKTMTQLQQLLDTGVVPEVAEFIRQDRRKILKKTRKTEIKSS